MQRERACDLGVDFSHPGASASSLLGTMAHFPAVEKLYGQGEDDRANWRSDGVAMAGAGDRVSFG
jgi:hypothetical protein